MSFRFSSQLCDSLDKCRKQWCFLAHYALLPVLSCLCSLVHCALLLSALVPLLRYSDWSQETDPLGSWRDAATAATVATREKTEPHQNNYDGSNYITE